MTGTVTKKWGLLSWRVIFIGILFLLQDWAFAAWKEPDFIQGNTAKKTGNISLAISFKPSPASLATASATSAVPLASSSAEVLSKPKTEPKTVTKPKPKPKPDKVVVERAVKTIPPKTAAKPMQIVANSVAKAMPKNPKPSVSPPSSQTQSTVPAESLIADTQLQQTVQHQAGSVGKHEPIVTEPVFSTQPKPPRYPTLARKRGQEGTVWLDIWLDEKGNKSKLEVTQSSGLTLLDKSALKAVSGWQFKPYEKNGLRIASRVRIPVVFSLN